MESFPFLQLPPELRNHVYSFALQSQTGTLRLACSGHTPASHRKSWTRDYIPQLIKPLKSMYLHENDYGNTYHPYHQVAPLTLIPHPLDTPKLSLRRRPEFNQLKYVCRSLYDETAGFEIHYNEIIIAQKRYRDQDIMVQYHLLLSHLSASRLTWLRTITLVKHTGLPHYYQGYFGTLYDFLTPKRFEDLQDLCALCKRLPNVNIKVVLPGFTYHKDGQGRASAAKFLFYGALAILLLRDAEQSVGWNGIVYRKMEERARALLQERDVGSWRARNLRFFTELNVFDDEEFRRLVRVDSKWLYIEGFGDMEVWVKRAKAWVEEGF
jgi:hypothetical protein